MVYRSVLENYLNGNWEDLDKHDLLTLVLYFEDKEHVGIQDD
jgi:hypothetical protein